MRHNFASAARVLDMSPASVSKYVAELESHYQLRLFNRTTRSVSLTDAGQLLFERSSSLVDLFDTTEGEMLGRATHPSGRLNLTAPHALMQTMVVPLLGKFMAQHPDVSLHLKITNRVIDMADCGIDLALRVGRIGDSSLIVRRLLPIQMVVAAAPDYWRQNGQPEHPRELLNHRTLAVTPVGEPAHWHFSVDGKLIDLPLQPILTATDSTPLILLARSGFGVVRGARMLLRDWTARGALEPLFGEYAPRDVWLYAAYMQRHHQSAALNELLGFLESELIGYSDEGARDRARPAARAPAVGHAA